MDLRESLRIRETSKIRRGLQTFDEEIVQREGALAQAREAGADADTVEELSTDVEIGKAKREKFLWEHDTTGALKGDRFGSDLAKMLNGAETGQSNLNNPEFRKNTHVIQVNMGELDRLNSSGDHKLGDEGLRLTFETLQDRVRTTLKESGAFADEASLDGAFDIYRSGSDFSITLKNIPPDLAERVHKAIPAGTEIPEDVMPGQEPAPLTTNMLSLEQAHDIFLRLREVSQGEDATVMIDALKEGMMTFNDFERVRVRCLRVIEKAKNERAGEAPSLTSKKLYEEFLKKSLGSLFLEAGEKGPQSYESFIASVEKSGAFEDGDGSMDWKKKLFERAQDDALLQMASRKGDARANAEVMREKAIDHLKERAKQIGIEDGLSAPESRPPTKRLREFGEAERAQVSEYESRLAEVGLTQGEAIVAKMKQEIATLEAELQANPSKTTEKKLELAKSRLSIEQAKRDTATGLERRGVFFQDIEAGLQGEKPLTVGSVDMAFLKYFDKEGGTKTGDAAILGAGRILDRVARDVSQKHNIQVKAYRVGGDEFAFTAATNDPAILHEITSRFATMSEELGTVPPHEGATENFDSESLQFNVGMHGADSGRGMRANLEKSGIKFSHEAGSAADLHEVADMAMHQADHNIAPEKAINRFVFLMNRTVEARQSAPQEAEQRQRTLTTLLAYSEKSIFGEDGKNRIAAWSEALSKGEAIESIVTTQLIPFLVEKFKQKSAELAADDSEAVRTLEHELKFIFLSKHLEELEGQMEELAKKYDAEHSKVAELKTRMKGLSEEKDAIAQLRAKIKA